jgi:hypothetical protein
MIHQRNVPHVCQHVYVMGGYIRPPDESEGYRYILPNLPRGLVTVLAASVLNSLICHPVTTRFIGWNDRHHHHICHADKHHILFSAWVRLVICLFSSDIFTSWFYTGYFVWFLMWCLSAWQMKWVGISGPLMNQGVTGWQMVSRVSHNTPPYPTPNTLHPTEGQNYPCRDRSTCHWAQLRVWLWFLFRIIKELQGCFYLKNVYPF